MTNQSEQAKGLEYQLKQIFKKANYDLNYPFAEYHFIDLMKQAYQLGQQSQPCIKQWVSEWINAKDRLPPLTKKPNDQISTSEPVWIYDKVMGHYTAWLKRFDKDSGDWDTLDPHKVGDLKWECPHYGFNSVTHWQPLSLPIPNSTTAPKSDMVSKAEICKLMESEKINSGKRAPQITVFETLHNQHIDEIITKIKEI